MRLKLFLVLVAMALTVPWAWAAPHDAYPDITHGALAAAIKAHKVTLIDCNDQEVYKQWHLPGAIHYYSKQKQLASLLPPSKKALIVSYCANSY